MARAQRSDKTPFLPLLETLKKIQSGMESERPPQVMLAAPTMEEFKRQNLPVRCKVVRRKIRGRRVPVRGRRQISENPSVLANWPLDGLVEGVAPTLLFVVSGEADIRLVDYVVHCRAGDILFIPARIPKLDGSRPHYEKITPEAHCDILMLSAHPSNPAHVSAALCHSHGDRHESSGEGEACWVKNVLLGQIFFGLGDELQNKGSLKSTFHLIASVASLFQEEVVSGRGFNSLVLPSDSQDSAFLDPIQHATEYIQNHLNKPLSIDIVARWVGLSRTAFTKRFRAETNQSFKAYLTRLRLEQAKTLLCQSNLSIERISERVGLAPGQLRALFRQSCRCTPREFRQSQKDVRKR